MTYLTEPALAERLDLEPEKVAQLRLKHKWPHLRFGRFEIRYTEAQVAQIEALHTVKAERPTGLPDQTELSAKRSA